MAKLPEVTQHNAVSLVQKAVKAGRYSWTNHAKKRMTDRDISIRQVVDCLKLGQTDGLPELDEFGNYRCRIKRRVAGATIIAVAALEKRLDGNFAVIVTAFDNT